MRPLAAQAFGDYEYFTDYIPNEQQRTRFLRTMLEIEIRINDGPADFFTAKEEGKIVAVTMLCPPEYQKPSDMAYMRAGFGRCFLQGASGMSRHGMTWRARQSKGAKGERTVKTAAPTLFAFMGLLSSFVGLSAWRSACALHRYENRRFHIGQRQ